MKNPIIYIKNVSIVFGLKLRYKNRIQIGKIQSFERIRIEIEKKSHLNMGSFNQNREKLYIGVFGEGKLEIGSHCFFNINSSITCANKIIIGDNCKFGNNLVIVDHDHNYRAYSNDTGLEPEFLSSAILIGNNVWVGSNVVILRGSILEDNCVISAGSIVKGRIKSRHVYIQGEQRQF